MSPRTFSDAPSQRNSCARSCTEMPGNVERVRASSCTKPSIWSAVRMFGPMIGTRRQRGGLRGLGPFDRDAADRRATRPRATQREHTWRTVSACEARILRVQSGGRGRRRARHDVSGVLHRNSGRDILEPDRPGIAARAGARQPRRDPAQRYVARRDRMRLPLGRSSERPRGPPRHATLRDRRRRLHRLELRPPRARDHRRPGDRLRRAHLRREPREPGRASTTTRASPS